MALFNGETLKRFLLTPQSTIHEAMTVIDKGGLRIALVVNDDERLLGVITDGDVRRGLLKGLSIADPIEHVYCRKPMVGAVDEPRARVLQKALDGRHQQIPILDHDGRPVGIEEIHELVRPVYRASPVIIMAGGQGIRLRPLTSRLPKPMLRLGNKPVLEHIVERCRQCGFTRFIFCVNYLSEVIKEHFRDGAAHGVHIDYVDEVKPMGTAGALGAVKGMVTEPFLVMNGDLLTELDYAALLDFHISEAAAATMCVRQYDIEVPFGVVNVRNNLIQGIEEKPIQKFLVNAGIYALSPQALDDVEANVPLDMPDLFNQLVKKNMRAASFLLHEYWLDIGRHNDLEQAWRDMQKENDEER